MARTNIWRLALATFAVVLVLTLAPGGAGLASDATPDHEAHHAGTPAPDDVRTVAATPAAGQGSGGMPGMGTATPGMGMLDGTPGAGTMMPMGEFDLMFIDMMTAHHEGAISMSEVARERGEHPELVELAQQIIDSQQAEIEQMQAWREQWYPDAPVLSMDEMMGGMGQIMAGIPGMQDMAGMPGMGMMGMMDPEMMAEEMRNAPEPFDLAFINAMLPHHMMALMMSEMAVQNAVHPELAELALGMIEEQTGEIGQMNAWRTEWYGGAATPAS